ncbi:MAG TPA: DUF4397 domain-containing protein [Acidobacteriota bacterium]|nr:DUF4397 domain-containing protein [Acidobacteriota bacterium]
MKRVVAFIGLFTVLLSSGLAYGQTTEVTLDAVTGLHGPDTLLAGEEHWFAFRFTSLNSWTNYNITNGWRVFSDDGAQWTYPYADTTYDTTISLISYPPPVTETIVDTIIAQSKVDPAFKAMFDQFFINEFNLGGMDVDTIGIGGVALSEDGGLPDNSSNVGFFIPIQSRKADHGKHICIDSSWYEPGGTWKWAPLTKLFPQIAPDWSGQQCYTVFDPDYVPPKILEVSTAVLDFSAVEGGADPAGKSFDVSEAGDAIIPYTATKTEAWVGLTNASGSTPATVTVDIDITGLAPGLYKDTVVVSSAEADNPPQKVAINLDVTPSLKYLQVSKDTLKFTAIAGDANPPTQPVLVIEQGGATIDYAATTTASWITVDQTGPTTPSVVTIGVDASGLSAATEPYEDSVKVEGPAENSPLWVHVLLTVEAPQFARLQLIHNAADPPAATGLDLYVNDNLVTASFAFRSATPFIDVRAGIEINLELNAGPLSVFSYPVTLTPDVAYVAVFNGVVPPATGFLPNPDGRDITLTVFTKDNAREIGSITGVTDLFVLHGITDAPTVDILVRDGVPLVEDLAYGDMTDYLNVGSSNYILDITPGDDNATVLASYEADLTGLGGGAAVVFASGFTDPEQNNDGPSAGLFAALPNGTVIEFPQLIEFVVDPDTVRVSTQEEIPPPVPQSFDVAVTDGSEVVFDISTADSWIVLPDVTQYTTPAKIYFSINVTGMPLGEYIGSILVSETIFGGAAAPAGADDIEPVTVYVKLTIEDRPKVLVALPNSLSFTANEGDVSVPTQTFDVSEELDAAIPYAAGTDAWWIVLTDATGTTPGQVTVGINLILDDVERYKDGLAPGTFLDSVRVTSTEADDTAWVKVSLEITPCPELVLDDVERYFEIFEDSTVTFNATVNLTSSGAELYWNVLYPGYFILPESTGTTPSAVSLSYSRMFPDEGEYEDTLTFMSVVVGGSTCASEAKFIVKVKVSPPPSADTLIVESRSVRPGGKVTVPVIFTNDCNLYGMSAWLTWPTFDTDPPIFHLDSISYEESVLGGFGLAQTFSNVEGLANFSADVGTGAPLEPGSLRNWLNLHFSVSCDALPGDYALEFTYLDTGLYFQRNCGEGIETEIPEVINGAITVDTSAIYFCGWVVNSTDGSSIGGATIEMWTPGEFPFTVPLRSTASGEIGSFAFSDFTECQFDLWAYKDGYYPSKVEGLNCSTDKGVKIELDPTDEPFETPFSNFYYCGANTYLGGAMPVGSIVEVRLGDGLLVGHVPVTVQGSYGSMPVYGATPTGDPGAEAGDTLYFFVNDIEAVTPNVVTYPFGDKLEIEVCLTVGLTETKVCELVEGWNLVSWNVDTESDGIGDVLGPYWDSIDVVIGFEQGGLIFDPLLPMFSTLWEVDHLSGYWIRIKDGSSLTLSIEGFKVATNAPIDVTTGWNLVSYLPEENLAPATALANIVDNIEFVYGFPTGGDIEIWEPAGGYNGLTAMAPCAAYWVKVNDNATLRYPGGDVTGPFATPGEQRGSRGTVAAKAPSDIQLSTNWVNLYSPDLKLDGRTVGTGSVVTAHAASDGSKVGSFTLAADGHFGFMPVYAGDGTPLNAGQSFYLEVNGVETKELFEWTGNGARIEVVNLSAKAGSDGQVPTTYSLGQNYPNPFNPATTLTFTMPAAGQAKLQVFNILGELIATPFDGQAASGENSVIWDGRDTNGETVASGVYLYRLTADNYTESKKMLLLK